jgi:hypothetical protein
VLALAQQPSQPTGRPLRGQPPDGHHGTPAGWKFRWADGDPVKGRAVFAKFECYACHEVRGRLALPVGAFNQWDFGIGTEFAGPRNRSPFFGATGLSLGF